MLGLRRGRVSEPDVRKFWTDLIDYDVTVDQRSLSETFFSIQPLMERHRLTAYDAAYLELAVRRGLPLATLDSDLASAARAEGVPLLL